MAMTIAASQTPQKSVKPLRRNLAIQQIKADLSVQARVAMDVEAIEDYAAAMRAGAEFPPMIVFHDGKNYWLANGFHRREAYLKADITQVPVAVYKGTKQDARRYSAGADGKTGVRRSHADKRRAVQIILDDPDCADWSNNRIAKHCNVSDMTVAKIKAENAAPANADSANGVDNPKTVSYINKYGQPATMNVGNLGNSGGQNGAGSHHPMLNGHEQLNGDNPAGDDDDDFDLAKAAAQATITHDTMSEPVAPTAGTSPSVDSTNDATTETGPSNKLDLTDEEWLETLPLWRVLRALPHKGVFARRDLLSMRYLCEQTTALSMIDYHIRRTNTFKEDLETPLGRIVAPVTTLLPPEEWKVHAPCFGSGCKTCDYTGYDLSGAGIPADKIENGEVQSA